MMREWQVVANVSGFKRWEVDGNTVGRIMRGDLQRVTNFARLGMEEQLWILERINYEN